MKQVLWKLLLLHWISSAWYTVFSQAAHLAPPPRFGIFFRETKRVGHSRKDRILVFTRSLESLKKTSEMTTVSWRKVLKHNFRSPSDVLVPSPVLVLVAALPFRLTFWWRHQMERWQQVHSPVLSLRPGSTQNGSPTPPPHAGF